MVSLTDLKKLLGINPNYQDEDSILQQCLDAASSYVARRCRYSLVGITGYTEYLTAVQPGKLLRLALRPISNVSGLWRPQGGESWEGLEIEVISLSDGLVIPRIVQFPPYSSFFAQPVEVKITYDVSALTDPPQNLKLATARLATYWYERARSGGTKKSQAGDFQVEAAEDSVPAEVESLLGEYARGTGAWV